MKEEEEKRNCRENQDILKTGIKIKLSYRWRASMIQVFPPESFPDSTVRSSDDLFVLKSTPNRHTVVCFLKSKEAELTQNLSPVGFGPSSNT